MSSGSTETRWRKYPSPSSTVKFTSSRQSEPGGANGFFGAASADSAGAGASTGSSMSVDPQPTRSSEQTGKSFRTTRNMGDGPGRGKFLGGAERDATKNQPGFDGMGGA